MDTPLPYLTALQRLRVATARAIAFEDYSCREGRDDDLLVDRSDLAVRAIWDKSEAVERAARIFPPLDGRLGGACDECLPHCVEHPQLSPSCEDQQQ